MRAAILNGALAGDATCAAVKAELISALAGLGSELECLRLRDLTIAYCKRARRRGPPQAALPALSRAAGDRSRRPAGWDEERVFATLVARNAINFHAPAHQVAFVRARRCRCAAARNRCPGDRRDHEAEAGCGMTSQRIMPLIGSAKAAGRSTSEALARHLAGRFEAGGASATMLPVKAVAPSGRRPAVARGD